MDKYDGIVIGDLVTELFMNNGTIDSKAIGKQYDLKLRSDLTAQSPNVKNNGIDDTSNVFEVVETYGQSTNEIFETAKDIFTETIGTIDTEHKEVHEGHHFFDGRLLEIPANTTWNWVVETTTLPAHVTFEVLPTNGAVAIATFEGITANENGTLITPLNNNRLSNTASTIKFRLNPTGISTASAISIRTARIGTTGGTSQRAGGNLARTNELIFKPNTKYLLTIQNLNNDVCYVNLTHQFYEHTMEV